MAVKRILEDEGQRYRIAERAYELFLQEGCEHGNDIGHWLRAEQEISEKYDVQEPEEQKVGHKSTRSK